MKTNKKVFYLPMIIIAATIFILSSIQQPEFINIGFEFTDKILHFIAYFSLGSATIIGLVRNKDEWSRKKLIMVVLLIGALYGASDETHQLFVPGRSCDIADWIADCVGISFSLLFINIFDKLTFRIMTRLENKV